MGGKRNGWWIILGYGLRGGITFESKLRKIVIASLTK
jgi:hypothetical protein